MSVAELIEELRKRPPEARVYLWEGDNARFEEIANVTSPSPAAAPQSGLPKGSVVLWS